MKAPRVFYRPSFGEHMPKGNDLFLYGSMPKVPITVIAPSRTANKGRCSSFMRPTLAFRSLTRFLWEANTCEPDLSDVHLQALAHPIAKRGLTRDRRKVKDSELLNGDLRLGPSGQYLNWLICGVYKVQSCNRMCQGPVAVSPPRESV
jgi:hypothetical protein